MFAIVLSSDSFLFFLIAKIFSSRGFSAFWAAQVPSQAIQGDATVAKTTNCPA
jgi:hypothetical protein